MLVLHRGEVVGELSDEIPDMWFLEGRFAPSGTPAGHRFVARATTLDRRAALEDPTLALRVRLADTPTDRGTLFVVMSLADERLFGRRVFQKEAVEWAETNVPE